MPAKFEPIVAGIPPCSGPEIFRDPGPMYISFHLESVYPKVKTFD
jgi:hypothetical protein